jgi:hypothetical protein
MEMDDDIAAVKKKTGTVRATGCNLLARVAGNSVTDKEQKEFLDFSVILEGPFVLRKKDTMGNPFAKHNI